MLMEPALDKLRLLHLFAFANAWIAQRSDASSHEIDFDTRLGLLIEAELTSRDQKKLQKLLKDAKLRISDACMEGIEYAPRRELDKAQIRSLATGRWLVEKHNVLITGMTGTGKTYIACALAQLGCRLGMRALYTRTSRLFEDLALAHATGTFNRLLTKLAKVDVLVLDDWGLTPMNDQQRRDIMEIIDDRHGRRSTVLVSQLPVEKWHDHIGDPTIADAVLDRLVHNAQRITPKGPTRRKIQEVSQS